MKRRPPRSTRTDTLFPYTTLFRSETVQVVGPDGVVSSPTHSDTKEGPTSFALLIPVDSGRVQISAYGPDGDLLGTSSDVVLPPQADYRSDRSISANERRVGKEGVSTCRSWWAPSH